MEEWYKMLALFKKEILDQKKAKNKRERERERERESFPLIKNLGYVSVFFVCFFLFFVVFVYFGATRDHV